MPTATWSAAEAKAKFSEVMERARTKGPQTVTKNGRRAVVIVSAEEWEQKTKPKENLAQFLLRSPLRGSGIRIERMKGQLREVDF